MTGRLEFSLLNIVLAISEAVEMFDPYLASHHARVAYMVNRLAEALGLPAEEQNRLTLAGAMHDIGILSMAESQGLLKFEIETRPEHGEIGYLLLKPFTPLSGVGELIRDHHVYWQCGAGDSSCGHAVPLHSHLIHLADRICVLIDPRQEVLIQVPSIRARIAEQAGRMFVPRFVEAFLDISDREVFWLDATSMAAEWSMLQEDARNRISLDGSQFTELARLFCHIVDFKSPFTAAHSSGVAACAGALGRLCQLSDVECDGLTISGYLHDIGKLSVPLEILEKPGRLDAREIAVIRHHSYETYRILRRIGMDENIRSWSAYHHERLDGSGYPFHLSAPQLTPGCRIMTIADIFTALVEDRPYRRGMARQETMPILQNMTMMGWLDGDLIRVLSASFEELNDACQQAEVIALQDYQAFETARLSYEQQAMIV